MKRILILIVLVGLAGVAGVVVRSASRGGVAELRGLVSHQNVSDARDTIRQKFELSPGARVELAGLNGPVTIETSDTKIAEVSIERTAPSQEALDRRKIFVEADANSLRIHAERRDSGFFSRFFNSGAKERVTLKLPRQIALNAKGLNGALVTSDIDGTVEVSGVNGRVHIASATGRASFKGINGSVVVGLKKLDLEGVTLSGINGNIELQCGADVNADLEARGIHGRVVSDLSDVTVEKYKGRSYQARIGSGGSVITAKGINGNIRLTGAAMMGTPAEVAEVNKN